MRPTRPARPTAARLVAAAGLAVAAVAAGRAGAAADRAGAATLAAANRADRRAEDALDGSRSTLLLANLADAPSVLSVDLFNGDGFRFGPTRVVRDAPPLVPQVLALADLVELGRGRYAATVFGARPLAAAVVTGWSDGAAVLREPADEGFMMAVPYAPRSGEHAVLHIQHPVGGTTIDVALTWRDGSGATVEARTIVVGPNATAAVALEGRGAAPGWLALDAVRPFGAQLTVAGAAGTAFDVGAVAADEAADRLYAPFVARAAPVDGAAGRRVDIRLALANPGGDAALVRPTFVGAAGSCAGFRLTGAPFGVPAGGQATVDLAAEPALPDGCRAAAVVVAVQGRVIGTAVATDRDAAGDRAIGAYRLPSSADTGTRFWVPRLLRGAGGRASSVVVQSAAEAPIEATLRPRDAAGAPIACARCRAALAPGAAARFDARADVGRGDADGDWAEVVATGPVVVAYGEAGIDGGGDEAWSLATRIEPPPADVPMRRLVPHLERDGDPATPPAPGASTTPDPTATATPTATRRPAASPTAGGGRVTLYAVAVVNVHGNDDPGCPACDGRYDDADRDAAARSPLPALEFVVRDGDGGEVTRQRSLAIDRLQVAALTLPGPPGAGATLAVDALPDGWIACPNAPALRSLDGLDFTLGVAKVDFHLSNTCLPANRPPLEPVAVPPPTSATATPAPSRAVLLPYALRGARRAAAAAGGRGRPPGAAGGRAASVADRLRP